MHYEVVPFKESCPFSTALPDVWTPEFHSKFGGFPFEGERNMKVALGLYADGKEYFRLTYGLVPLLERNKKTSCSCFALRPWSPRLRT